MGTNIYNNFGNILEDKYEVIGIVRDLNGTKISVEGISYSYDIIFGAIGAMAIYDEGNRIVSYNEIEGIKKYRENKFYGNPLFEVKGSNAFGEYLLKESCGFSSSLSLYAVVTQNDFIEIASSFPPQIILK